MTTGPVDPTRVTLRAITEDTVVSVIKLSVAEAQRAFVVLKRLTAGDMALARAQSAASGESERLFEHGGAGPISILLRAARRSARASTGFSPHEAG